MSLKLFQKMNDLEPDRNVVYTAIDKLNEEAEIKQFIKEYIEFLKNDRKCIIAVKRYYENAEQLAKNNILYALGHVYAYTGPEYDFWIYCIEQVTVF